MPRNGSGIYSPPAGTTAVENTIISPAAFNNYVADMTADANNARPISAGGTGGTSQSEARAALGVYSKTEVDGKVVYSAKSADYTGGPADNNGIILFTASATFSLTSASALGSNWHCTVKATGGAVTIDPNGVETIDGFSTISLLKGHSLTIVCDGSNFFVLGANDSEPIGRITPQNGSVDIGCIRFGEGGTYSRSAYPELAAWMDANGTTAFALSSSDVANGVLPDWRDYSIRMLVSTQN